LNSRKLARLIYPEYRFGSTDPAYALRLVGLGVGGFCFYGGTAEEVYEASRTLKAASETPLLIASDYENGAGQWVAGATELPSNMAIGASGSQDLARRKGGITALEARALGVDWVLAPVADLGGRAENPIVNVRAFGADHRLVTELAEAYLSGVSAQGALSCLKHFPGHGDTAVDSHLALPVIEKSLADMEDDLAPFGALARRADTVMAGHLMAPALDAASPASLSRAAIAGLLRGKLRFEGLVLTDALNMKAVADGAGLRAFQAGADVLLYPEDPLALHGELARAANDGLITERAVDAALARQDALVRKLSPFRSSPLPSGILRCAEHLAFNAEAAPNCLAWAGGEGKFQLKPGETVGYFEPLTKRDGWKGAAFADELSKLGARVEPYQPGCGMRLAAGLFNRPRAGSGAINLGAEEKKALEAAIAGAASSAALAFGSPYVLGGLRNRPSAALCAFCALEEFQRAAARALFGATVTGRMPVAIA
jgi:beta-glucosidase